MALVSGNVDPEAAGSAANASSMIDLVESRPRPLAYTDAEVGSLLRISKRTVYRLRKSGVLQAIYIGRAVRTPAEQVLALLK
jgi:excisionase family DNA binding protein